MSTSKAQQHERELAILMVRTIPLLLLGAWLGIGIYCTVPTDPTIDPTNVRITILLPDSNSILVDSILTIRIPITLPALVDSVRLKFGDGKDTLLFTNSMQADVTTDTFELTHTYHSVGAVTISLVAYAQGVDKPFERSFIMRGYPAQIIQNPEMLVTRKIGEACTLSVVGAGTGPLRYVWLKDGAELPLEILPQLILGPLAKADSGLYRCRIANSWGLTVVSEGALLIINASQNRNPSPITNITPADNAENVSSGVGLTLSWAGGDDPDGDDVSYVVRYGRDSTDLKTAATNNKSIVVSEIPENTICFWYIFIVTDKDTMRYPSAAGSFFRFRTAELGSPAILQLSGPATGTRVVEPSVALRFKVTHQIGIDSVFMLLNGLPSRYSSKDEDNYTFEFVLSEFGINIINIVAFSEGPVKKRAEIEIVLDYNTFPLAASGFFPENGAKGIDYRQFKFSWNGGTNLDGDTVEALIKYGKDPDRLSLGGTAINANEFQPISIESSSQYYWSLILVSGTDSIRYPAIGLFSFFTVNHPTTITGFSDDTVHLGQPLTFSVSASDPEGIKHYVWDIGNDGVPDTITSTGYITTAVKGVVGSFEIRLIVSDMVGAETVRIATITFSPENMLYIDSCKRRML